MIAEVRMLLHAIYRSSGKVNRKPRPSYFSKQLSLHSFLRAYERAPNRGSLVFLNDAPVAPDIHAIMEGAGQVIDIEGLTLRASYCRAIALPRERGWAPSDLVYFAEDDYLFHPEAFVSLAEVAQQVSSLSYFAFYASQDGLQPNGSPLPRARAGPQRPGKSLFGAGFEWRPALGTTSSFAAHVAAINRDAWFHRVAGSGRTGLPNMDHPISLTHKGHCAFSLADLAAPFRKRERMARAIAVSGCRALMNLAAISRKFTWRQLYAPAPPLATHLESAHMALGTDWEALAAETRRAAHG